MEPVMRFNILMFKILGAWDISSKCYLVYKCLLRIAWLFFFTSAFRQIFADKLGPDSFNNAYASFNSFGAVVKLLLISRKNAMIIEMLDMLDSTGFQAKNEEQKKIADKARRMSKMAFGTFLVMGNVLLFMWISRPILESKRELPVESWYPFDYQNYYVWSYLWQSVNFIFYLHGIVCVDLFYVIILIELGMQCDFLLDSIDKLEQNSNFTEVIVHHQEILRFSSKFQELYGSIVLIQLICSMLMICSTLFLLNLAKIFSANFFIYLLGLSFMLTQVMLYCLYGNMVIQKSENFQCAAFETDWYSWSEKSKKKLLFFIHRTRKPIAVLIGNVYPTNLPIFLEILRRSWAFFMTLRSMQNK